MTYFEEIAKKIVSKNVSGDYVSKSEMEKIIVILLSEMEHSGKNKGRIYEI